MGFIEKLRRKDNFWIGFVLGIALPLALYPIIRPLDPQNFDFIAKEYQISLINLLPMLLSRCIFPNALIFFLFIWGNFNKTAKGILISTMGLVGILVIIQIVF